MEDCNSEHVQLADEVICIGKTLKSYESDWHRVISAAEISEVACTTHPLGIRPAGEGGITPALGVVINAVVDALSEYGVKHIEMPATPERIWRAIQDARMKAEG